MLYFENEIKLDSTDPSITFLNEDDLLFDIETTGLSRKYHTIYLIGCANRTFDTITIRQYFAESAADEPELLSAFYKEAARYKRLLSFNGLRFDIPFMEERRQKYPLELPTLPKEHLDIYKACHSLRSLLHLTSLRQKDVEAFLGIPREDLYSGGELTTVYKTYCKDRSETTLALLKLHNYEDVLGMIRILPILSYRNLQEQKIHIIDHDLSSYTSFNGIKKTELTFKAVLSVSLPVPIRIQKDWFYLILDNDTLTGAVRLRNDTLKHFIADYRNYYYLPKEDIVIPKIMASCVDTSERKKATAATCYVKKTDLFLPLPIGFFPQEDQDLFQQDYKDNAHFVAFNEHRITDEYLEQYVHALLSEAV